jgi:hypothetical protein
MLGGAIAAGVGAAVSAGASMLASGSEEDAAGQATAAGDRLTKEQMMLADKARQAAGAYQTPYYNTGTAAQNKLAYGLGITNEFDTPTDTSFNAFSALKTNQKQQIQLQLKALGKGKKGAAQRQKLQKQLDNINASLKGGKESTQYQAWQSKQPGTKKTSQPIDSTYGQLLQDNPEQFKFEADPGYQFRKEQGERDLNARLAQQGLTSSGAALRSGMEFNQGLGAQEYQSAWERYKDRNAIYNQNRGFKVGALSDFAQTGQQAANQLSNNENIYGSNVTGAKANQNAYTQGNINAAGNARSAGYVGAGNALMQGANSYLTYKGMQEGMSRPGTYKNLERQGVMF